MHYLLEVMVLSELMMDYVTDFFGSSCGVYIFQAASTPFLYTSCKGN